MALQKSPINIPFKMGMNTKSDPRQLPIGSFLLLQNMVFDNEGLLKKRNGFDNITTLPNALQTTLTTLNDNLLATGSNLYAYSADNDQWFNKGTIQPVSLSVKPLVRVSTAQSSVDMAVASNGLACLVYVDNSVPYFQISDSVTGQQILGRTSIVSIDTTAVIGTARVFYFNMYFIVLYTSTVSGVPHLRYIAIPSTNPSATLHPVDLSSTVSSISAGFDALVVGEQFFYSWAKDSTHVLMNALDTSLTKVTTDVSVDASHTSTLMSMCADYYNPATPVIWITYYDSGTTDGYSTAFYNNFNRVVSVTKTINALTVNTLTTASYNSHLTVFREINNTYGGTIGSVKTDYISVVTCSITGSVSAATVILRSVGLASKAFLQDGTIYVLATYGETNQPTYFLIDSTGAIYSRLAYSNGGGYITGQVLPNVSTLEDNYYIPYLIKDFLASVNKSTNLTSGTPVNAIYTQTGVNLAKLSINAAGQYSSEIASALHLTGGQVWEYDGVKPVEHSFHVWPENVASATATGSGSIAAGTYFYSFCYEWTDNVGNLHRSAPSIPIKQVTTTASSTNTLYVPTLRLTAKVSPNPVRIVGYRWSAAQQTYYQFTSLTSPTANDTTADYVTITDTLADASILGNVLLYTTGGVLENIAAPACTASALFKNRLFIITAEDMNLLWFSKQILENTPVEFSDNQTLYVAPTTGTQGSTGPALALGAMDDKLIIFKRNALYYVTGIGPDATGNNNDFSDPVYIQSSVGCANPSSVVLTPAGLMFQSDKGIWLLGRDLSTNYIGAPVDVYNSRTVKSAQTIPGTNQVRFVLDNGITLIYDYFYQQWGTFTNTSAVSATLYNNYQTYLNSAGKVFQETPGSYLDGSSPVLMAFTTGWINIAGVQGYERFYELLLMGTYYSPFKLSVGIAYDYNSFPSQLTNITPDNYTPGWGGEAFWGSGSPWGGGGNVFNARLFPTQQKCSAFQIQVQEIYDPSIGVAAGQGLDLSGVLLMIGAKRGSRTQKASQSFG